MSYDRANNPSPESAVNFQIMTPRQKLISQSRYLEEVCGDNFQLSLNHGFAGMKHTVVTRGFETIVTTFDTRYSEMGFHPVDWTFNLNRLVDDQVNLHPMVNVPASIHKSIILVAMAIGSSVETEDDLETLQPELTKLRLMAQFATNSSRNVDLSMELEQTIRNASAWGLKARSNPRILITPYLKVTTR